jgi:hypothetical protein
MATMYVVRYEGANLLFTNEYQVIQKLIEHGDETQRGALLKILEGNVVELSLHTYGCRVVQKVQR